MDALRGNPGWRAIVYVPLNGNRLDESKVVLQESGHFGSPYPPLHPPSSKWLSALKYLIALSFHPQHGLWEVANG